MAAYTIVQGIVTDASMFTKYTQEVLGVVAQYGGRYLVLGSDAETLEGVGDARKVVVHEWPDIDAARKFWYSTEYQSLKKLREGTGDFQVTLVEGVYT
ncbi:MAG: hypothetical protein ACI9W7_000274 [Porticoccaceae bacterium]|jgi:uncharacterized protein (DUF1330 family)|tara:strand:+ start:2513 stop:2806 length:294 start_codon:yes stop_codon:yes gene_type:complete